MVTTTGSRFTGWSKTLALALGGLSCEGWFCGGRRQGGRICWQGLPSSGRRLFYLAVLRGYIESLGHDALFLRSGGADRGRGRNGHRNGTRTNYFSVGLPYAARKDNLNYTV